MPTVQQTTTRGGFGFRFSTLGPPPSRTALKNLGLALLPSTPAPLVPDVDRLADAREVCIDPSPAHALPLDPITQRVLAESIARHTTPMNPIRSAADAHSVASSLSTPNAPDAAEGGSPSEAKREFVPYRGLTSPDLMRRFCFDRKTSESRVRAGYWDTSLWLWLDAQGLPTGEDDRDWCQEDL